MNSINNNPFRNSNINMENNNILNNTSPKMKKIDKFEQPIAKNFLNKIKEEIEKAEKEDREPLIIPHFSAHHLRHTFCTRLCENESNLKVIQSIMGHSDITTTMDIYAEATQEKKQEIVANLQGKIII